MRAFEDEAGEEDEGGKGRLLDKVLDAERQERLIQKLESRVLKVSMQTFQEQVGNDDGIVKTVNMWQGHVIMQERESGLHMFYNRSVGDDARHEYCLSPNEWHSVILQFIRKKKQDEGNEDVQLGMRDGLSQRMLAMDEGSDGPKEHFYNEKVSVYNIVLRLLGEGRNVEYENFAADVGHGR